MRSMHRTILALLLCLSLCLILAPGVFAEGSEIAYDSEVIVSFDTSDFSDTIDLDHKYSLSELQKMFPAQLAVYTGGIVTYTKDGDGAVIISGVEGAVPQVIDVAWECVENYDKHGDVFHFVPILRDYELADALEKPVITVNVLGQLPIPPLMPISMEREYHTSWSISDDRRYDSDGYPSAYSNRASMPPIRDQNPYGTCWAFGTIAAVEGDLIHDGAADSNIDLSELHLAYFTYHDFYDEKGNNNGDTITINPSVITRSDGSTVLTYLDNGGSTYFAYQTLANMLGPVAESLIPYSSANGNEPSADMGRLRAPVQITDVHFIDAGDMGAVKDAIMAHGAVSAAFHAADETENYEDFYSSQFNCFYYPTEVGTNHIISLVGWDDSFPASSFVTAPEGNGAWLVRNSWGDNADSYWGYFWLSYYDKSLGNDMYAFDVQPWQYDHCYAYDNSPATFWRGAYNDGLVLSQNYQVDGGEQIEAIGFTLEDPNVTVIFTLTCGNRTVTATANSGSGGYHLVPLAEPLVIAERSPVTLEMTYVSTPYGAYVYGETASTVGSVTFSTSCGSGGLLADGSIVEGTNGLAVDGRLKLFTNDANISGIAVDADNFPDSVFRAYVSDYFDTDGSGYLNAAEIADATAITFIQTPLTTLKGIEHFPMLETLYCIDCGLDTLDISHNTHLVSLFCFGNNLETLNISQNTALEVLNCGCYPADPSGLFSLQAIGGNRLTALDVSHNTALRELYCGYNALKTLDVSQNPALSTLYCEGNELKALNVGSNSQLHKLYCGRNQLEALDISGNTQLEKLYCYGNRLTTLNTGSNPALDTLYCGLTVQIFSPTATGEKQVWGNDLTALDVSQNTRLTSLHCDGNDLTSIELDALTMLSEFSCAGNALEELDLSSNSALVAINCWGNQLEELDLSGNPNLRSLECYSNDFQTLNLSNNALLTYLDCCDCGLAKLDLTGNPALAFLACFDNELTKLNLCGCPHMIDTVANAEPSEQNGDLVLGWYDAEGNYTLICDEDDILITPNMVPDFVLPASLDEIEENAFAGGAFTYVKLPDQAVKIGPNAFAGCRNLACIYIPFAASEIDDSAFGDIGELVIFGVSDSPAGDYALRHGYAFVPLV